MKYNISEHAALRYAQRVKGFDLHAITNEIVTEYGSIIQNAIKAKARTVCIGGVTFAIKGNTVTTVAVGKMSSAAHGS